MISTTQKRLELSTSAVTGRRSNQLSHWAKYLITKNARNIEKSTFLASHNHAADRNRTGTGITTHGILSPGRLPVPPLRHSSFCANSLELCALREARVTFCD